MPRPVIRLHGHIQGLRFNGQPVALPVYEWAAFDINKVKPACKVRLPDGTELAVSKWTGPKRTRTYPLAKVYDTYSHGGKIITVIPIVKDEGQGERENDTNLDRVNFITFSWMNLMNIYIVLAWYSDAKKKDDCRITAQQFESEYVRQKIAEIAQYKMDAHHWNRDHFVQEFIPIYENALQSYESIAQRLGVALHKKEKHVHFLESVRNSGNCRLLDLERYAAVSLSASERAALRETGTEHALERIQSGSAKGFFKIQNYLGGVYYLTTDEVVFEEEHIVIQESKNSTRHVLPSMSDIKDGLFKLLLFSQIEELYWDSSPIEFRVRLRLTGKFKGKLHLPAEPQDVREVSKRIGRSNAEKLEWLNTELSLLKIEGIVEGSSD